MTCRDCIHHNACADLIDLIDDMAPNWKETFPNDCKYFDETPINYSEDTVANERTMDVETLTDVSEDTAAEPTMDEVGAQLINLYAEYSRMVGYTDDDYAKAVCIAVRMLSD